MRYVFNNGTVCQLALPYVDSMKAKGICFEGRPFTAEIRDAWQVEKAPTFIVMRRDADEEIGRVVGLSPETQRLVEDYVAKAKTLKNDAPKPQIVEVAYQAPDGDAPCSPETQTGTDSLITVNDFDIPALREDAEISEEKKSEPPAQNQEGQVFTEPFPKRRIRRRFPRLRTKRRSALATTTSLTAKVSSTSIFTTDVKTQRRKNRKSTPLRRPRRKRNARVRSVVSSTTSRKKISTRLTR
ncbi:MAG: hypothetical protein IJE97_17080 [Thermoguttaceae bacterium]|nr:hypothetical protein [Thermoguttaceae bacterium]